MLDELFYLGIPALRVTQVCFGLVLGRDGLLQFETRQFVVEPEQDIAGFYAVAGIHRQLHDPALDFR